MPKIPHALEIHEIDWGWDGCRYLSYGHHDPIRFLVILNEYGDFRDRLKPEDVKHGRMRCWPDKTGSYDRMYQDSEPGRGAFPVTYVESK